MKLIYFTLFIIFLLGSCKTQPKENKNQNKNLSDEALLDQLQRQTFNYFWEGAEPNSGLARERIHTDDVYPQNDKNIVTTGGSGFGIMAILVGIERGFITREQAVERYEKIFDFLEKSDRFHGAWSHWIDGETGKAKPFSSKDNGGDLVETAFLVQGMITVQEYFRNGSTREQKLSAKIKKLWHAVEWDWYTNGEDVLFWHWSPDYNWEMNFRVGGYNECLIMYVLAAASPTHSIKPSVYHKGWARNGDIASDETYYNLPVVLDYFQGDTAKIGPMFWSHYSYTGLNPRRLKDRYGNYNELTTNHAKIQHKYAVQNPEGFQGYGKDMWGLTSSYSVKGYKGHRPGKGKDLGVITPTAALASYPYTPKESMNMIRNLYENHDSLIGKYGPYDAFSFQDKWFTPRYLAIDQGPIPVMIENQRSGLLWDLFMQNKQVQNGLKKLGFEIEK